MQHQRYLLTKIHSPQTFAPLDQLVTGSGTREGLPRASHKTMDGDRLTALVLSRLARVGKRYGREQG